MRELLTDSVKKRAADAGKLTCQLHKFAAWDCFERVKIGSFEKKRPVV
jgi:hypothetical protein